MPYLLALKWDGILSRAFVGIILHISFLQQYACLRAGDTFNPLLYSNAIQVCILQARD